MINSKLVTINFVKLKKIEVYGWIYAAVVATIININNPTDAMDVIARNGIKLDLDQKNNIYQLTFQNLGWKFAGKLPSPCKNINESKGVDRLGVYSQVGFDWQDQQLSESGYIRVYDEKPLVLFSNRSDEPCKTPPSPFPDFTELPRQLHVFSYQDHRFAPPSFCANECSTPWLLFDDHTNAMVISPASHFMVASMFGDGHSYVASGLNTNLCNLPEGFSQQTILAFGNGINRTWDLWGHALNELRNAQRPDNEADALLEYLGYWTDNGATYYYDYDPALGYAGTLQALVEHYRQEHIPIHYLQLDSWWYYKSLTGLGGKPARKKNTRLPSSEWNRSGGLLEYKPAPTLFTNGLAAFQETVGLPLVTHNRWIDLGSPYRLKYKMSGLAAVDPQWWDKIADYISSCGVVTYEQDWLDAIYKFSPKFSGTIDTAETFLDDMARACSERNITMQYCMAFPCYFLQGSGYKNLTSIRVSDDRFCPDRWNDFFYASRLADSLGIWPWTDVFMSTETNNLLLATLSAGVVGIGDTIGKEDKSNLLKAIRADGMIVKPDAPIVPLDQSYLADANHRKSPLVASTFTQHGDIKTEYIFAFNRPSVNTGEVRFTPFELGYTNMVCLYDYFSGVARLLDANVFFSAVLNGSVPGYYIIAPIGKSGIAFLGDDGKFVSTGRQRIESLRNEPGCLTVILIFAESEKSVILHGFAQTAPVVTVQSGRADLIHYNPATQLFTVEINPDSTLQTFNVSGNPVRRVTVEFRTLGK